jgi:hypothetical protein
VPLGIHRSRALSGSAQAVQGLALLVFPLTFVSSAYVPVETMPSWLQLFAEHQPLTVMVDAGRALVHGAAAEDLIGATAGDLLPRAIGWSAALVAVVALRGRWVGHCGLWRPFEKIGHAMVLRARSKSSSARHRSEADL